MIETTVFVLFWLAMISFALFFITKIPMFLGTSFMLFAGSGISSMYVQIPILNNMTTVMTYAPQYPIAIISSVFAILSVIFFFFELFK
jgi:hypothetical protein